uniref:NFACT-R_1 domain-containing protein n=1 Tax=Globodera pallida TaxID=36090 RepID=A0A183C7I6_GLOPA
MDAISFVLGERTHHLRVKRLGDLIHGASISIPESKTCCVRMIYRNADGSERIFQRTTSEFRVGDSVVNLTQYHKALEEINIFSKARNFLVYQGAVEHIAMQNPKELTQLFEELSKSSDYKEDYEMLKEEMHQAEAHAQTNLTKKRDILIELREAKQERNEARRFQTLKEELTAQNRELFLVQLFFAEKNKQLEFMQLNSVPTDCKEQEVFARLRSTAFKLHSENAFWGHAQLSEETKAKMMQCKMETNPVAFVRRCILLRSQRQSAEAMGEDSESLKPAQLDFYVFTLPYVPAHYACLAVFNGALHHGAIAVSKQKAKISCAEVLSEVMVKEGWADVKKAAKKRKNIDEDKILKKRRKEDEQLEETNARTSHHYVLTLHPNESLDPKTHFLLAISAKSPIQLLKEIADREKFVLSYAEIVDEATGYHNLPQGKESTLWSKVAGWPSNWKNSGVFERRLRVV